MCLLDVTPSGPHSCFVIWVDTSLVLTQKSSNSPVKNFLLRRNFGAQAQAAQAKSPLCCGREVVLGAECRSPGPAAAPSSVSVCGAPSVGSLRTALRTCVSLQSLLTENSGDVACLWKDSSEEQMRTACGAASRATETAQKPSRKVRALAPTPPSLLCSGAEPFPSQGSRPRARLVGHWTAGNKSRW